MTNYHFSEMLVWDNLGGYIRPAANVRSVSVVNPLTGLTPTLTQDGITVTYLTSDSNGRVTFIATVDVVRADFGDGSRVMYSDERLTATSDAAPALAAAATAQATVDEVTTGTLGLKMIDPAKIPDAFMRLTGNQTVGGVIDFTLVPTVAGMPMGGGAMVESPPGSGFFVPTIVSGGTVTGSTVDASLLTTGTLADARLPAASNAAAMALKAPLDSPALTGTPTVNGLVIGAGGAGWMSSSSIVETATGVWSGDAPVRTPGQYPVIFSGVHDPADPTNGITTPANINAGDVWLEQL